MFDREKAIQDLVDNDLDTIMRDANECGDLSVLAYILETGFKGYINYTNEALLQELRERDMFRSVSNG